MKITHYQNRDTNGQFIKSFGKKVAAFIKTASFWGFIASFIVGVIYLYGYAAGASTITYKAPEIKEVELVKEVTREAPVLQRIAKCESGNTHYDKNGQVLINKSQDIGVMQINVPIWGKKAHDMGLNLAVEEDNRKFADYLYENFGTEPWIHSRKCWVK